MDNQTAVGMNRTGLDMAPLSRETQLSYAQENAPRAPQDEAAWMEIKREYALESTRVGSVPLPARMKGMASTVMGKLKGNNPEVLIDKLGERLAYERTGVRLYDALILKAQTASGGPQVPVQALSKIREDEAAHMGLVAQQMVKLGADPTAMTPCADTVSVDAAGHVKVINDPRTTMAQALNSILMIELGDNASWELLIELAAETGHDDMAAQFTVALDNERQHLELVRGWLREAVLDEAT